MQPSVDLAPGAEDNALASKFAERIRAQLEAAPDATRRLFAMRATVLVVAPDQGDHVTLRFDHGRLTIHDGTVGVPTLTICADHDGLLALGDLPRAELARRVANEEIKVYGLLTHPRLFVRLIRLFSPVTRA